MFIGYVFNSFWCMEVEGLYLSVHTNYALKKSFGTESTNVDYLVS